MTRTILGKGHAVAIPSDPHNPNVFDRRDFTLVTAALLLPIVLVATICLIACNCMQ